MNKLMRRILRSCKLYDAVVDFKHWMTGTDREYVEFYGQFIGDGDLCFDIGANVGRRTGVFLRLGATVLAVEPQDHCMKRLERKYGRNDRVVLVKKAVGPEGGEAQMMMCDSHSLSSLSQKWVESVRASGRYAECTWDRTVTVPVVTLDSLISEHGRPAFTKIDVEGYEYEVLKGLSKPIGVVCFEFTPEFIESTLNCIKRLSEIGAVTFNYCFEHTPTTFGLLEWVDAAQITEFLTSLSQQRHAGDIYARFNC